MMETGYYHKPKSESSSVHQESKQILSNKKMAISSVESTIQAYKQNLLKFEFKDEEDIRDNGCSINSLSGVIDRFSKNLALEPDVSNRNTETDRENLKERVLTRTSSSESLEFNNVIKCSSLCQKEMENFGGEVTGGRSSSSKICSDFRKGKELGFEVEQVKKRLEILEEDNKIMKKALFSGIKERNELLSEIFHEFLIVDQNFGNLTPEQKSLIHPLSNINKDGSMVGGLLEVLQQDSNPSLVSKVLKANIPPAP